MLSFINYNENQDATEHICVYIYCTLALWKLLNQILDNE